MFLVTLALSLFEPVGHTRDSHHSRGYHDTQKQREQQRADAHAHAAAVAESALADREAALVLLARVPTPPTPTLEPLAPMQPEGQEATAENSTMVGLVAMLMLALSLAWSLVLGADSWALPPPPPT